MMFRTGFTLIETVVAISLSLVLAGIALPILGDAREEARRVQCAKQIGNLANGATQFEETFERLPPLTTGPGIVDDISDFFGVSQNHQHMGAVTYILPFIEKQKLFDLLPKIATQTASQLPGSATPTFADLIADPGMVAALSTNVDVFICPSNPDYATQTVDDQFFVHPQLESASQFAILLSDELPQLARTSYLPCIGGFIAGITSSARAIDLDANQATSAMRNRESSLSSANIPDGASNVICWGENVGWIAPPGELGNETDHPVLTGANIALFSPGLTTGNRWALNLPEGTLFGSAKASIGWLIGSMHPDGSNVAMCDGSVRFLSRNTSRAVSTALGCGGDGWMLPRR